MFILSANGRVLFANACAEALLSLADALCLRALPMRDGQDRLQLPGRAAVLVLADEVP